MWNDEEYPERFVGRRDVISAWALFAILLVVSLGVSGIWLLNDRAGQAFAKIREPQQVNLLATPEATQRNQGGCADRDCRRGGKC